MFTRFLNENKVLLINCFLIILIILSFIFKNYGYVKLSYYLKASGCLGLSCSIINWIALQILLDKLYFLYTVEKMRKYFLPIKNFLIKDIFGSKNFSELKEKYTQILNDTDKNNIKNAIELIEFDNILRVFQNQKTKNIIKNNILNKIFEIEDEIKIKLKNDINNKDKNKNVADFFNDEILPIIEDKLELSIITKTQNTIYDTIKSYFEWLVLWGAFCGSILGIFFRFCGCL